MHALRRDSDMLVLSSLQAKGSYTSHVAARFLYHLSLRADQLTHFAKVMVALVISISSDTSEESVDSHASRVILFGVIPAIIPIIPEVLVVPAEPIVTPEILPPAPDLPLVSPFLCSDDMKADGESEPAEQRPISSSHDTLAPLSEFLLTPVVAPPGIRRYRYSSPDSSYSNAPSDHSLSGHTPPDTTDADSSTPQRFVHRSLARTPRHSEAFRRWRSAPLSTPYPLTTSESSLGSSSERSLDSSSPSSRTSHKRCRSPTTSVPSPTHVSRSRALTPDDLLPPRKRFRDSYSLEDSKEEHMEVDTADAEAVADIGISEGVVTHPEDGVGMRFEIAASHVREDDEDFEVEASVADTIEIVVYPLVIGDSSESSRGCIPDLEDTIYDIVYYMSEVRIDRITKIKTTRDSWRLIRWRSFTRTMTITRFGMTPEAIEELVNRRVEEALAAHEATCAANVLEAENQSQNGSNDDNGNGGNGNGENRNGGNGNPNENGRGDRPVARECTYQDFMKNEIQKMETKLWNLTVKNNDLAAYTQRFQELTRCSTKMVPEELQDAVRIANNLMDQKLKGYSVKNAESKRRLEVNQRDNRGQQPPFKRPNVGGQNVARAYTAGNNEKKPYNGLLPLCNKCKLHHEGPCTVRCRKCNKVGHLTRDCKVTISTASTQRGQAGNKNGVGEARGKAYVLGRRDANPDSNVVKGTFILNNNYAFILFDSGADRSFVSTTFSNLLDITPDTLDVSYAVELADGRIVETNTVLRGCTLGLLGHPFIIDLMPVELGSFDNIIGMDWLANHHAVIICEEKIMWIPYGDEVLKV
ncbi:putative reverse transcriptase domain-containing protein [Tanacetum coccineum]